MTYTHLLLFYRLKTLVVNYSGCTHTKKCTTKLQICPFFKCRIIKTEKLHGLVRRFLLVQQRFNQEASRNSWGWLLDSGCGDDNVSQSVMLTCDSNRAFSILIKPVLAIFTCLAQSSALVPLWPASPLSSLCVCIGGRHNGDLAPGHVNDM